MFSGLSWDDTLDLMTLQTIPSYVIQRAQSYPRIIFCHAAATRWPVRGNYNFFFTYPYVGCQWVSLDLCELFCCWAGKMRIVSLLPLDPPLPILRMPLAHSTPRSSSHLLQPSNCPLLTLPAPAHVGAAAAGKGPPAVSTSGPKACSRGEPLTTLLQHVW